MPLCEFADEVFMINPCPRLQAAAKSKTWVAEYWRLIP